MLVGLALWVSGPSLGLAISVRRQGSGKQERRGDGGHKAFSITNCECPTLGSSPGGLGDVVARSRGFSHVQGTELVTKPSGFSVEMQPLPAGYRWARQLNFLGRPRPGIHAQVQSHSSLVIFARSWPSIPRLHAQSQEQASAEVDIPGGLTLGSGDDCHIPWGTSAMLKLGTPGPPIPHALQKPSRHASRREQHA